MSDLIQWVIVALAVTGFIFNTGILWNDVRHHNKSIEQIWKEINEIKKILIERSKE